MLPAWYLVQSQNELQSSYGNWNCLIISASLAGHFEFVFVQVSEAVEWFWQNRSVLLLRVHNIFFHQEDNRVPVCCFRYHEDFGVRH